MQVSGFGRYKTPQAQRIAEMRLSKQRKDLGQAHSPSSAPTADGEGGKGGGQRPVSAPPARGSAARRCAEIQGRRDAWRNGQGMVWKVQPWFEDKHGNFDSDARQRQLEHIRARCHELSLARPVPGCMQQPKDPKDVRIRGQVRKAWAPCPAEVPRQEKGQGARIALQAMRNGEEAKMKELQVKQVRDRVRGDLGDRYERGPDIRVGKNKGGALWDASPDLLRLMGKQETRNLMPRGELGRKPWDPPRNAEDKDYAARRQCQGVVRYLREERAVDQDIGRGAYWCDRDFIPPRAPATGHGHGAAPMPQGKTYRERWPHKAFPHKYAPGGGPVPEQ
eukprot:Tamp_13722.p1 GENE.Tamp_13722~~Tamp_13722.p1  ORF type:complete len:335 (+),score=31.19 Tamp_13722:414-1418(+)